MSVFPLPRLGCEGRGRPIYVDRVDAVRAHNANPSLALALTNMKAGIDQRATEWNAAKRLTNPYEYIHSLGPRARPAAAAKRPLSRAYFKLVEIGRLYDLFSSREPMRSLHLAEGPGGFVEACVDARPRRDDDRHVGMTLAADGDGTPGWRRARRFLAAHTPRVTVETCEDGTGNMLSVANFREMVSKYKGWATLVTADGGVDFSSNYADQERTSLPLVIVEVCYALACQARGGTLVLKLFDTMWCTSAELLYFLAEHYEAVSIVKPDTSRAANSERYAVCSSLRLEVDYAALEELVARVAAGDCPETLSGTDTPPSFLNCIRETNSVIGQRQLENMVDTFDVMDGNSRVQADRMADAHMSLCARWCATHGMAPAHRERASIFPAPQP